MSHLKHLFLQDFNIEGLKHISPENALEELKNGSAIFIDVREESEFMIEFIPINDVYISQCR